MAEYKMKYRGGQHIWHVVIAENVEEAYKKFLKGTKNVTRADVLIRKIKKK